MTKAPRSGTAKTRLVPPLALEEAAELSECFLRDTADAISEVTKTKQARGIAVYTPTHEEDLYSQLLPKDFLRIPQRGETLGERLAFALEDLLQLGFASACLIDSDSPTVPSDVYAEAVTVLARPDDVVVLGASADGGYYLIGMKKLHCELFEAIEWSSGVVYEQSVERAKRLGLNLHLLPKWYDVDDHFGLHALCSELFGKRKRRKNGYPAPITRRYLDALFAREGRARVWPQGMRE